MTDCKICAAIKKWASKPYDPNANVGGWFLFIGLMGAISFLWSRILIRVIK